MAALKNIALWGVGGENIGSQLIDALVQDGTFNMTVLARASSKSVYPSGLSVVRVDDALSHASLVSALQGQDAVVSAVGHFGIEGQVALAKAALEAGVKRFLPSEFGFDNGDPANEELSPIFAPKSAVARELIAMSAANPNFTWTGVATGLWLDWALDGAVVDIDPSKHTATYWDEGAQAPSITTLAYASQAVRQVLRHPELFVNQRVYVQAFAASQRDIVAELERQQGVTYATSTINGEATVQWTKDTLAKGWDFGAAMTTVKAELWVGKYKADFVKAGKQPILEDHVEMPKVTLQDVVREFVATHKA